jgi:membrane-associated phospholipid phosphatase
MAQLKDAAPRAFRAVDIATLLYLGVATAAVLWFARSDPATAASFLVAHALIAVLVFLAPRVRTAGPVGEIIGAWYPMVLLAAFYGEVGLLNLESGYHYDALIQRLEVIVFGSQVSYQWVRAMPSVTLSWVLHTCYLAYYLILIAAPLGLWLTGRREAARYTIFALATTFYCCYVVFLFFPVAGPRYAFGLASNAATHVWPARAAQWVLDLGDSWGAAFPSSHVAGAAVATVCALRFWRPLGWVLLPWSVGLVFAVVYGQFHYAVDALAGLGMAAAVVTSLNPVAAGARAPTPPLVEVESPTLRL